MPTGTYASPLSFVGSTRRLIGLARRQPWLWPIVLVAIPAAWLFLVVWYVIVFGLFGLVTIPFRLIRRGQRKSLALQRTQLEEMRKLAERESG